MAKTTRHAPTTRDFDRQFRAQLAQMTAGLAPTAFATAWADWAMHLAQSPARQGELQREALKRAQDTWAFVLRALSGAPVPPSESFAGDVDRTFRCRGLVEVPLQRLRACLPEQRGADEGGRQRRRRRERLSRPTDGVRGAHAARCVVAVELPGVEPGTAGADRRGEGTEPGARAQAPDRRRRAHASGEAHRRAPRTSRSARPSRSRRARSCSATS